MIKGTVGSSLYVLQAYEIAHNSFGSCHVLLNPGNIMCGSCFANFSCELAYISEISYCMRYLSCLAFICFHLFRTMSFCNISVIAIFVFVLEPRAL